MNWIPLHVITISYNKLLYNSIIIIIINIIIIIIIKLTSMIIVNILISFYHLQLLHTLFHWIHCYMSK